MSTSTYFDRREGRERPLPDCSCAGLVWDESTQRCELPQDLMSVLNGQNRGLGFLSPGAGYGAAEDADSFWDEYGYWDIDSFWDMGGPGWGGGGFGFATSGNQSTPGLWDDLFYFYLGQGYDPFDAAAMADADAAAGFVVSVETSESGGLPRVSEYDWQDFVSPWPYTPPNVAWDPWGNLGGADSGGGGIVPTQSLPGACGPGTYHPYPIGHPRQDECAPFPTDPAARAAAQRQQQRRQAQQSRGGQQAQQQTCPRGQYRNPTTRRCEPIPNCPAGQVFSPAQGRCLPRSAAQQAQSGKSFPWWWLLLGAGALLALEGTREQRSGRGRR